MADYRKAARDAARRYGLDPDVFTRQIQQESGFNPNARSPAGAQGIAQIMPATARGWKVDPMDPIAALNAAAKNMRGYVDQYGSYRNALVAYNAGPGRVGKPLYAETANYIKTILGGANPKVSAPRTAAQAPSTGSPISVAQSAETAFAPLQLPERPNVQMTMTGKPAHAAGVRLPAGYSAPAASTSAPAARFDAPDALKALEALQVQLPSTQGRISSGMAQTDTQAGQKQPSSSGNGKFKIEGPNPDRLKPGVRSFAAKVADIYGGTLTGKDGSTHSKYTTTGNVSDHYSGNATDIFFIDGKPATGARLIAAGRAALIAAGMDPKKARKAPGGLYNVGGHQIIFGVTGRQNGGNHLDHLHISAR